MHRFLRYLALILWLIASSMGLALFWVRNAEVWNPVPRWVWDQLDKRLDIGCCEQGADVEYAVVLGASVLTMTVVTTAVWGAFRWMRRS